MEKNINILKEIIAKLPSSGPSDFVWTEIDRKLNEFPLKNALGQLPEFEPDSFVWESIENKASRSK